MTSAGPGEIVAIARLEGVQSLDTLTTNGEQDRDAGDRARRAGLLGGDPAAANGSTKRSSRRCWRGCWRRIRRCGSSAPSSPTSSRCAAAARSTSRSQPSGSHASTTSRSRPSRRRYRIARRSPIGRAALALQTPDRRPRPVRRGQAADRTARARQRRNVRGEDRRRRRAAAVLPGSREGRARSAAARFAGFPVVDVHVTLFDGSFHAVDSSEASFKTAASMAIRDGVPKCSPVILEPILSVEAVVPEVYGSAILGQLTGKRGSVLRSVRPSRRATTRSRHSSRRPSSRTTSRSCAPPRKASERTAQARTLRRRPAEGGGAARRPRASWWNRRARAAPPRSFGRGARCEGSRAGFPQTCDQ